MHNNLIIWYFQQNIFELYYFDNNQKIWNNISKIISHRDLHPWVLVQIYGGGS